MSVDLLDDCEPDCVDCHGLGWEECDGVCCDDLDCDGETHACSNCLGSGMAKDQRWP